MALKYTEEQLYSFDKNTFVQLFLIHQPQLKEIKMKPSKSDTEPADCSCFPYDK